MVLDKKVGWSMPVKNKMFFFETKKENKCKTVIDTFIKAICNYNHQITGQNWDDTMKRALNDEVTRKDIAYRLQKTTYELRETDEKHLRYVSLSGDNFGGGYDVEEVVIVENLY